MARADAARPDSAPAIETQRTVLRFALLALLLLAPLPFGSVQSWAVLGLQLYAALLGGLTLVILGRDPSQLSGRSGRMLGLFGVLLAIGCVQLIPMPASWTRWVVGPTADARAEIGILLPELAGTVAPPSIEPPATLDALLRLAAYLLIGLAAIVAIRTRAHVIQLAVVVTASGAFQALYGSTMYLSGDQRIFGYAKEFYRTEATGTFINPNHFSGYLAMTLALALAIALDRKRHDRPPKAWRFRIVALGESNALMRLAAIFAALVIWGGILLSYSRAGIVVGLIVTGLVAQSLTSGRGRVLFLSVVVLLPALWFVGQSVRPPGEQFLTPREEIVSIGGRMPVWSVAPKIVADYTALGSGLGTFEPTFSRYRPPELGWIWDHAHNDWIEATIEAGVIGGASLVLLLVWTIGRPRREDGFRRPETVLRLALAAAIIGVAAHSVIDFGLRIPALATLLAVLAGVRASGAPSAPFSRAPLRSAR